MENDQRNVNGLKNIDLSNLQKLCRGCLSEAEPPFFLFSGTETLSDVMWSCIGVKLAKIEGLPSSLCTLCHEDLIKASQFKIKVQHSTQMLQESVQLPFKSEDIYPLGQVKLEENHEVVRRKNKKRKYIELESEEEEDMFKDDVKSESSDLDNCEVDDNTEIIEDQLKKNKLEQSKTDIDKKAKIFICEKCQRPLSSKSSLQNHMKTMHSGKRKQEGNISGWGAQRRFHCIECSYSTPHSQSLVYHMRVHTGEKPFKCDVCNRCFSQPAGLNSHKRTHSSKTYFTCAECGKQFKYKESYELHKNVHIGEKKFICNICNKGLKAKKTLESHMNRHLNIKNYSCETCGAMFVTRVELLNHSRKHMAEKKYTCNLCDYKTYLKKTLEIHLQRHRGDRPFGCEFCDLTCYTKGELKRHRHKHTKEKNYCCPVCSTKFVHGSSVNKHMLKVHGIKYNRQNIVDRRVVK